MMKLLNKFDHASAKIPGRPFRLPGSERGAKLGITDKRIQPIADRCTGRGRMGVEQQENTPRPVTGLLFIARHAGIEHPESTLARIRAREEFHKANIQPHLGQVVFHGINDTVQSRAVLVGEPVFDINITVERRGAVGKVVHACPRIVGTERALIRGDRQDAMTSRTSDGCRKLG